MMTYIGARYTPDFLGTHDPTQSYEALCVVDNGMGTSYISRKPVPVNTPLNDTEYWALYGAPSGAIINLQNQIDIINNTDIPALNTAINGVKSVTDIFDNAANIKNKKICVIGDSLSFGNQWVEDMKTYVNGYCQIDNYSQSGKQWNNSDGSSNPCPSYIIPNLTDTYDIFIIFLGINDFLNGCPFGDIHTANTADTFNGAIEATYNAIFAHNNAAEVYCISPTKTRYNPNPNTQEAAASMYRLMIYSHCNRYGWHFIDAYNNAPLINISKIIGGVVGAPWLADGLHFASIYNPYFAHYILKCIIDGTNDAIGYDFYETSVVKTGFDYLIYGFDTNGKGRIKLKADIANVYDSSLYTLLTDAPMWMYGFDYTLCGIVTETVGGGSGSKATPALIKLNGQTIYFYAAGTFANGKIEIDCEVSTRNLVYANDFTW